jgi:hypothetical protein
MEQTHPATKVRRKETKNGDERTQALCSYAEFIRSQKSQGTLDKKRKQRSTHARHAHASVSLRLLPIEEAIDKMQFDVVDLLILSVGRVEDDKDVIPVRAAFSKL